MDQSKIVYGPVPQNNFEDVCLGKLFYNSLNEKNPSDILMVDKTTGEEVTRKNLLISSLKLAVSLQKMGIQEGDVVGIISPNTWKFAVPVLSALYIGAVVSPTDFHYLIDDLRLYFTISQPKVLFTTSNIFDQFKSIRNEFPTLKHIVLFDERAQEDDVVFFDDLLTENLDHKCFSLQDIKKENLALILFSSGTTGLPKGVMLTQENLNTGLKLFSDPLAIAINESSVTLGYLPPFHIFGILLMLTTILIGKQLILLQKFQPFSTFLKTIEEYKIKFLAAVPLVLLYLTKSEILHNYDLSCLNDIVCGGSPLGRKIEDNFSKRINNVKIRQIYGCTEGGLLTTTPPNSDQSGSVGKVLPGIQIKIIGTETGRPLDVLQHGEICAKGGGIMRGYLNNDAETRKCIDDEGYLHTGDVGYFDEQGLLYYVDRVKEMIKYKGFQVSPAQLENILSDHPAIKDSAVIGKICEGVGELPTAFILKQSNASITEEEIIQYVAEKVSKIKQLHGGVIFVDEIPRSPSGKILRRQLSALL